MLRILPIVLFISMFSNSQNYKILSVSDSMPIPYANILYSDGRGASSDANGNFKINGISKIDYCIISSIGFQTITLTSDSLGRINKIFLKNSITDLDEVILKSKKGKKRIIDIKNGLRVSNVVRKDFTYEEVAVTYIPYPKDLKNNIEISISNILVNTTGLLSRKRKYYPFKVNLYSVNNEFSHPRLSDSIMIGIITSRKEGSPSIVSIDISKEKIKLNENGIYVSFETLRKYFYPSDTLYKVQKKIKGVPLDNYNDYAAAVKTIDVRKKKSEIKSFSLKKNRILLFSDDNIENYWKLEEDFIYDVTIEIEY